MKKLVGFLVFLVAAGGGWWYYVRYADPPAEAQVIQGAISRGDIVEGVSATGVLDPVRRYDIGSQVSGVVTAIHVDYNSIVKKGQLLAEIEPSLLQVKVDIQQAAIDRQLNDIQSQKMQLDDQKRQFERTKDLFERGLVNEQAYEAAELSLKTREASIATAEKSLVSAYASLESAKLNVGYTRILAPADGVIVERKVDVGQTVQASMTAPSFFVMSTPLESLKLTANVDESEIGRIRPGMEVRFTVDTYDQQEFRGTVDAVRLNATSRSNVVTYPVWITVPNPDLKLRPSMTVNLRIVLSTAPSVVRVPMAALRFRPTSEVYTALGLTPPETGTVRLADLVAGASGPIEDSSEDDAFGPAGPQGSSGRGGAGSQAAVQLMANMNADKIDDLWAPIAPVETAGNVWMWDEASKELTSIQLRLGASDGTFAAVLSGDVEIGDQIVTSVILPAAANTNTPLNQLLNQRRGGNMFGGGGGNHGPGGFRGGD